MRVEPLCAALGVEVRGLDLSRPLSLGEQDELRAAYTTARLLLFRGQSIGVDDHVRLVRYLGPVLDEDHKGVGYVSNVRPGGFVPEGRLFFHSDFAFTAEPCLGISLYALDVPAGCPTMWANAARAASQLPDDLRSAVVDASALHLFDLEFQRGDIRYREAELGPEGPLAPRWVHPVLLRHPVTGDEVLYVNEMQTDRIVGLDAARSEDLLQRLRAILYDGSNTYSHDWSVGDIVVWDNVALQHARPIPPPAVPRT
ncbi:MAG: TauD/TfdA dioxygenase family protein, partial [Acidimicrobiales bacterium]